MTTARIDYQHNIFNAELVKFLAALYKFEKE